MIAGGSAWFGSAGPTPKVPSASPPSGLINRYFQVPVTLSSAKARIVPGAGVCNVAFTKLWLAPFGSVSNTAIPVSNPTPVNATICFADEMPIAAGVIDVTLGSGVACRPMR